MLNFCTLFDSNYLARGIALYRSLEKSCPAFHLYVFAFDDNCYEFLKKQQLPYLTAISLKEFEDDELLGIKSSRSTAEYCWTCTPSTIRFCIQQYNLEACTYLDADMIFYADPTVLLEEMGTKSVLITKHRYSKLYDQSGYSGTYCVQFMCFKNTEKGMAVLNWWRDRCIEWCYARSEDGKFGDQKYLDDWTSRFDSVHVLEHLGGGIAPWNVQQYSFFKEQEAIWLTERSSGKKFPVIFYHFHGVKFYKDNKVVFAGPLYEINPVVKELFYYPYISKLVAIAEDIIKQGSIKNPNGAYLESLPQTKIFTHFIKDQLTGFLRYFPGAFHIKNYNFKNHNHQYLIKDILGNNH